jgi:hypothetical protein
LLKINLAIAAAFFKENLRTNSLWDLKRAKGIFMKSFSHKKGVLYLIGFGFLFLVGCEAEFKDKNRNQVNQQPQPASPKDDVIYFNVDDFTYNIKGTTEPHHYELSVIWPKTSHIITVVINKNPVKAVKPEAGNSFVTKLDDNSKFVVQLLSESNSTLKEWNLETPQDFVFNSTEILSQDTDVKSHRVFFKNKSFIETREFHFTVEADEMFFEDGTRIINFAAPPKIIPQKEGLNGGNVKFIARKAYGKIELNLNGGDGGNGDTAFPWAIPHANGKDGVPGVCEQKSFVNACVTQPINGENSPDGNPGKPGFPGKKGGSSGALIFEITEQSEVEVIHTEKPGGGGEGGDGGKGQMKGQPGKAAPRDETCMCPQGKDGEDTGKNGDTGKPGPIGPDGEYGFVCVSIGRGSGACNR